MKEGYLDKVLGKVSKRANRLSENLTLQLKGQKPPFREKISPAMTKWAVDNLGYEDMDELRQEFGDEAVGWALYKINKLRSDGRTKWRTEQI